MEKLIKETAEQVELKTTDKLQNGEIASSSVVMDKKGILIQNDKSRQKKYCGTTHKKKEE